MASRELLAAAAACLAEAGLIWGASGIVDAERAAEWVERLRGGQGSFAVFAAASSLLAVVKPTALIPVGAAVLFGFWGGLSATVASVNLGAWIGFWAGNRVARRIPSSWRPGPDVGRAIERMRRGGFWSVALVRFVGFPPAGFVQLACGMSGIAFREYAWGTLAGMLPWAVLMTYSSARAWSSLGAP